MHKVLEFFHFSLSKIRNTKRRLNLARKPRKINKNQNKKDENSPKAIQEEDTSLVVPKTPEVGHSNLQDPFLQGGRGHPASDFAAGEKASAGGMLDPFLPNRHGFEDEEGRKKGPIGSTTEKDGHGPLAVQLRNLGSGLSLDVDLQKSRKKNSRV